MSTPRSPATRRAGLALPVMRQRQGKPCPTGEPAFLAADHARLARRFRPWLEWCEDRTLLAAFIVSNIADSGPGSLRYEIAQASADSNNDTIQFSSLFNTAQTITLSSGVIDFTKYSGSLTIQGPGENLLSISGDDTSGIFTFSQAPVSLSGLTLTDGSAVSGGAVYSRAGATADFTQCAFNDNQASGNGGAIEASATVNLDQCTFSDNSAGYAGGAIDAPGITLTIDDSTFSNNQSGGRGGAIAIGTNLYVTIDDSTFADNSTGSAGGGAIDSRFGAAFAIANTTFSGNSSTGSGSAGGAIYNTSPMTLINTIVSGDTASTGPDIYGSITSYGYNLIEDTSGVTISGVSNGNIYGEDALLAPLGDYGGPTETMPPLPGSPAIGAGDPSLVPSGTDQRGEPSVVNGAVDIGAFETNPLVVNTTLDATQSPLGALTLRQAITLADALGGAESISFDPTVFATPQTIALTSSLPSLTDTSGPMAILGPESSLTIQGGGGTSDFNALTVAFGVNAELASLTFTNFNSAGSGGGIDNLGELEVEYCTFSDNEAYVGGGIDNDGTLSSKEDTFSNNSADAGGGVYNYGTLASDEDTFSNNSAEGGGGVVNDGTLASYQDIFANNSADIGGGVYNEGTLSSEEDTFSNNQAGEYGGAILNAGSSLIAENCTFADNVSNLSGGGIDAQGTTMIVSCTFVDNAASPVSGGGGDIDNYFNEYSVTIEDSIITGDYDTDGSEVSNTVTSLGHNLVSETDGGSGWIASDLTGTAANPLDPDLGPLGNYGGPTVTIPLLPGSPAIDAGIGGSNVPATDQRGLGRVGAVDIGAFESQGFTIQATSGGGQSASLGSAFANPLVVTVVADNPVEPVTGGVVSFATPLGGASASLGSYNATIESNGTASVTATANNSAGGYVIAAGASGVAGSVRFSLTNLKLNPVFSNLASLSIHYGASTTTLTGQIGSGSHYPSGDDVMVTLGSSTRSATINASGGFSVVFNTASLGVAGSPYTITYAFAGDASFNAATDATTSLTVTPVALTITANNASKTYGQSLTFAGTEFTASGLVKGETVGSVTLSSAGQSVVAGVGTYSIMASQATGGTFTASNYAIIYATGTLTVGQASTMTAITNLPSSIPYGQSLTLTAAVGVISPGSGNPTGQVVFVVDGQSFPATLDGTGTAQYTFASGLAVGPHTISAEYQGDPNFIGSSSATKGIQVLQASSTTQVFTSLSPTVFGQTATFRAVVAPSGQGTPTGLVQFLANGVFIGSGSVGAGGIATLAYAGLLVGDFSITADYMGDNNFLGSSSLSPVEQVVNQAATSTTVSSTVSGSFIFDQTATFVTQVQAVAPGAGIPSGFVALDYNYLGIQGSFGTEPLDASGRYTFSVTLPFVGSLQVFAIYSGSADFVTSSSVTAPFPVGQAMTTTTISSTPGPTVFGQPVTLKASVDVVSPGSGSPSGTVQFYDDGTAIGSPQTVSNGQAALTVSNLAVGLQSITAYYSGGADFVASTASAFPQVVSKGATTVMLEPPSTALPAYGQALTFNALALAVAPGAGVPTGTVDFYDEAGPIGMASLINGVASFSDSVLPVGDHSVYAIYTSDTDFLASANSNPVALTVTPASTTSTLTASTTTSTYGNSIRLGVSVKASPATFIPAGFVVFYDGSTVLGSATLDPSGNASLSTAPTALQAGANLITVNYLSSNGNNLPSTSPVVEVGVAQSPLTVVVNNQSMIYGGAVPTLTGTVLGILGNDAISATYSTTATSSSDVRAAGYPITASLVATSGSLANYAVTILPGLLTITPANQVIAWTPPASIVYGTPLSSTQLNASVAVVGPASAGTLTYTPAFGTVLNAGLGQTLTVNASGTIDYNPSTFSVLIDVTPAPLSVVVNNLTNVYGAPLPLLTGTITGLVNGDVITAQYSTTATAASDVQAAGYPITAALVATQGNLANYAVTILPGLLTITPANQVISWTAPASIVYGTPLSSTQLDASVAVVGPAPAGTLTYSLALGTVLNAGLGQTLTVSASGTLDYNPATYSVPIDVTPASLTVTPDSKLKLFGAALPALTGMLSGLVNGDAITASYSTTATATSDVQAGGYPITPTLVDPFGRLANYSVTLNPGVLTIVTEGTSLALSGAPTVPVSGQLPGTSVFGQSYTFTAVVSAVDSFGGVPTGSVNFIEGASLLGTSTLVNGIASFTTTTLATGPHTIVAQYLPGTDFAGPSPAVASVVVTVAPAKTTATVAASVTSTTVGSTVFFQATVRPVPPGAGIPSGLVQFLVDGFTLGSPIPLVGGQALTSTNKLTAGTHTINAYFLGSPSFLASPLATGTISILSTFAGTGNAGFGGDGGPAINATFNQPSGVAVDLKGNVYIADTANNRVRMIAPNGIITTVAGTGVAGDTGDGGLATKATLNAPTAVAVDALGDLFIADTGNDAVREVTKAGLIFTAIGTGDAGKPLVLAALQAPGGVAVDPQGLHLYVSDTGDDMVLEVTQTGSVETPGALAGSSPRRVITVAGTGMPGAGPNGPADQSALNQPTGLALDASGDLYIADTDNNLVRMVTPSTGMIETVAGKLGATANNDGGAATDAALHQPEDVAVDNRGVLYIADTGSDEVRVVNQDGTINSIVSGNTPGTSFQEPSGIANGPNNAVFIANTNGNNILSISSVPEAGGGEGGGGTGIEVFVGPVSSTLSSSNAIQLSSQLLALNTSSLELLATLTVMSIEFNVDANAETTSASALPNQPPINPGQSATAGQEETSEPTAPTEKPPAGVWSFIQYILGLDPSAVQQAPASAPSPAPAPAATPSTSEGPGMGGFVPAPAAFDEAIRSVALEGPSRPDLLPEMTEAAGLAIPKVLAWTMTLPLGFIATGVRTPRPARLVRKRGRSRSL